MIQVAGIWILKIGLEISFKSKIEPSLAFHRTRII